MRQEIKGTDDHPDKEKLKSYAYDCPEGTWQGRLDDRAWGKSTNLFCYFTHMASGERFRLSVFSRKDYKPQNDGPAFDEEPLGGLYEISTQRSKQNNPPVFLTARRMV